MDTRERGGTSTATQVVHVPLLNMEMTFAHRGLACLSPRANERLSWCQFIRSFAIVVLGWFLISERHHALQHLLEGGLAAVIVLHPSQLVQSSFSEQRTLCYVRGVWLWYSRQQETRQDNLGKYMVGFENGWDTFFPFYNTFFDSQLKLCIY